MMGTNESLYAWMDEGFTSYADARVQGYLRKNPGFWWEGAYKSYLNLVKSGREEPMSTHADHYNTNYAYSTAAYSKGCIFLAQLGYIVGNDMLDKILLEYYKQWRFKHPNPNDFIRIAEKLSNIELQWYKEYWVYTTKTIDYAVGDINFVNGKSMLTITRLGDMSMPVDVLVTYKDGSKELHYVPLNLMYGRKPSEVTAGVKWIEHEEWKWTQPDYQLELGRRITEIKSVQIDPSLRLADVNRGNNSLVVPE
jgi:aminopeptidase N